ncbi:MAG: acyl-CoA dehydrogenase family protein [Jatrophihabitans sp.]
MTELIASSADRLPLPGHGDTLARWQALAAVAAEDLALAKVFEGHTDALAILAELAGPAPAAGSTWATWAAEPPTARLGADRTGGGIRLRGRKAWCSGAEFVSHAVVTAWNERDEQCLAAVALDQPGVTVTTEGWHAVGMGRVPSGDVLFDGAEAVELGTPGDYLNRPGFWQGGAGIAACWFGGALPFATALTARLRARPEPHGLAHLGAVELAIHSAAAVLREAAGWIDDHPRADAQLVAMRARGTVEDAVDTVLKHAGRTLGAGPLCRDPLLAQRYADLPVFLRQSHAEQDLAALGELVAGTDCGWTL